MCLCFCNLHRDTAFLIKTPKFPQRTKQTPATTQRRQTKHVLSLQSRKQLTLGFFFLLHNSKERSLGKYLKEKPQLAGKEQNHIPERTHMCKPSHAHRRTFAEEGTCSLNISCNALSYGGGVETNPLVKQWLQISQNVWNFEVSHICHLAK